MMPCVGRRQDMEDDIVLTGMSGRLPESSNIEEFTQQLFEGVDLISGDSRRWTPGNYGLPERSGKLKDLTHFDATFFGVHAKQAHVMDPQLRLLLEVTYEAIVDAGLSPVEMRGSRTGVYVGLTRSESFDAWCRQLSNINGYAVTGCNNSMISNRISYAFDLNGPSMSIDTACSSSMHALAQAVNDIRAGRCDAAVVAGSNLCLDPASSLNYHQLTMLSSDGRCAAFDESGCGYVRSEAVVAVLLQRRRDARRVYCTVRGVGTNNDGYKEQGITYPAGTMQKRIAQETFEEARLRPQDVVYVEAHGTGTKVGDPEEINAIAELFCANRQSPLLVGSVKSNMGHAEPASGICSIVKVVMAMERGVIPGNLHYRIPNKNISALSDGRIMVVDKNMPWQGGLVAVNSFGFGGANAHVILEGGRGTRPPPARYPVPRLVLASGRTHEAVGRLLQLAADHPRDSELHAMIDAVHNRAIPGHPYRGYTLLNPAAPKKFEILETEESLRPVWFVFSGMGSQWAGMARRLVTLPTFAASIAMSARALEPYGLDLQYVITEAPDDAFDNVINSGVAVVAVQVALVDVLRELGIHPDGIIGHSVGEVGCAYADETLTREQAVLCAYWRGRSILDAKLAPGAMAALGLSWEEATRRCPADIVPACHNSADSVTVSGPPESIEKFVAELSAEGIFARHVNSSGIAFHSKYVAAAGQQSRARLEQLIPKPKPRSRRWLSSSIPEDQWDDDLAKLSDAAYFVHNLLSPVRFAGVLQRVPARALLVEVAPHALLQAVLRRALPAAAHAPLVRREAPDALAHLLAAVGNIYVNGVQPQVTRLYPTVSWPVSRGTPSLASVIGWDHTMEWSVADFNKTSGTGAGENIIEYDLNNAKEAFIAGHNIDGRILFPATGYLLAVENCNVHNLKLTEPAFQHNVEELLLPHAMRVLQAEPGIRVTATLAAGHDAPRYTTTMEKHGIKVSNKDATNGGLALDSHIVLSKDILSRRDGARVLSALVAATDTNGFVLLEESADALDEPAARELLASIGLTVISSALNGPRVYLLLRCPTPIPHTRVVLEIRQDNYTWVEQLKDAMSRAEREDMRVYIWSNEFDSGVQGLAKCLRREPGGNRLRAYYLPGAQNMFDPDEPAYKAQVQLDLAFNVLCDGIWGTFRHLLLDMTAAVRRQVKHAYVNTLTRGDLSSLNWIESNLHAMKALRGVSNALCHVYYAPLNFRDVMLATGKLPPDALPGALAEEECILGLEFSGRLSTGKRVMGMVAAKGLATTVLADESFMWDVPKEWSLEEAATVPVAYATAYYALCVRGRMRRGESVLVHAGAGGVGQAAIAIALHAGCCVFTTVGTAEKRAFLRERFPELPDANIGNSRDCSFEQLVQLRTCGRGVDLVLNSLAGDQLQASVRCLGQRGRFLEIGKVDLSANTALGLAVLLKNTTVHGILLDALFDAPPADPEKMEVARCVTEGIAAGAVRPLPTTVFAENQLEGAFRYMASGKHIGKVLIRVHEEDADGEAIEIQSAIPHTYMRPDRSYVLVGGLGGFGLELGGWLVSRGARTLVFNSRNGLRTGYQAWCIRRWCAAGVQVHLSRADVTSAPGARALLQEAAAAAPIGGIFNLAAVLQDAFLENQTQDSFCAVVKPKIDATRALDVASRELAPQLEYFVVFSSVSCGRGNAGQSNYGLANSGMERLCERRRAAGLPALAVQWGAVADVGLAAAMHAGEDVEVGGTVPQRIASCLQTLDKLLMLKQTVVSSTVAVADRRPMDEKPKQDLLQTIASILGIKDPKKVSMTRPIAELGMDSLMSAEIKQILERRYDMLLDLSEIRALTLSKLVSSTYLE